MATKQHTLQKKTVILIPGIFGYLWEIKPMQRLIEAQGYSCVYFEFKTWGRESYYSVEKKLEAVMKKHKAVGVIGFSTGGTLALGANHTAPVMSIAGPVHGTVVAYLWNTIGMKQLRPGSEYISHVLAGAKKKKRVYSTFTYLDITVLPGTNARVGVASGNFCVLHAWSCFWPQTQRDVTAFLQSL